MGEYDHFHDAWDDHLFGRGQHEWGEEDEGAHRECRDCGRMCYWKTDADGRWVLHNLYRPQQHKLHVCDKEKLSKIRTDAFDNLDE